MKRRPSRPEPLPAYTIEDTTMTARGFAMIACSAGAFVLAVALGVAVWRISTGIQWALIVLAGGFALEMALIGAGLCWHYASLGQAAKIAALGKSQALQIEARAAMIGARQARIVRLPAIALEADRHD